MSPFTDVPLFSTLALCLNFSMPFSLSLTLHKFPTFLLSAGKLFQYDMQKVHLTLIQGI